MQSNPSTIRYRKVDEAIIGIRVFDVYLRLDDWIMKAEPNDPKTAEHFMKLGRERSIENQKNSEVIHALILARVVLCRYIVDKAVTRRFIKKK